MVKTVNFIPVHLSVFGFIYLCLFLVSITVYLLFYFLLFTSIFSGFFVFFFLNFNFSILLYNGQNTAIQISPSQGTVRIQRLRHIQGSTEWTGNSYEYTFKLLKYLLWIFIGASSYYKGPHADRPELSPDPSLFSFRTFLRRQDYNHNCITPSMHCRSNMPSSLMAMLKWTKHLWIEKFLNYEI